jgi:hypothetical protein
MRYLIKQVMRGARKQKPIDWEGLPWENVYEGLFSGVQRKFFMPFTRAFERPEVRK